MVGSNSRSRTYYFRRCKSRIFENIPEEVLFEILVRVPAQDIYDGARLVCRKWYHITRTKYFIHKHLERAYFGLLYKGAREDLVFISAREDGGGIVDTYNYDYKTRHSVSSSWNGLTLEFEIFRGELIYYVTNILTNQCFRLPPCPYDVYIPECSGIGYDATSMTYKVVVSYMEPFGHGCGILTLGVDKSWRVVCSDHLSKPGKNVIASYPIITEGFVHWKMGIEVVTLNLETEILSETPPPITVKGRTKICFLSTDRYLSLFVRSEKFVWEVLEMNPETGEWRKLPNICFRDCSGDIDITPCGWLKYREVVALNVVVDLKVGQYTLLIVHNLTTTEFV